MDEVDEIPNESKLYYRISKSVFNPNFDFDDIPPMAFRPVGDDLSTNWEKHCLNAEACLAMPGKKRTNKTHGVGHFIAGEVRNIKFLEVVHTPGGHLSHASIYGIPPRIPLDPFLDISIPVRFNPKFIIYSLIFF